MKIFFLLPFFIIGLFTSSQAQTAQVYDVVQQMPQYPGGEDSMWKFISAKITYPDSAIAHSVQGKLIMGFVVNEDGGISDIKTKRGLSPDIDSEGVRIVKLLPHFTPGLQDGKAVKVNYTLPLIFKLKPNPIDSAPKVYKVVERMPQYLGGDEAMMKFIQANIKYPEYARDNGIQGRVVVSFVVNEDGSLSDIKVAHPVFSSLDAEAIRIVKLFSKFKPGEQQGKPVKVQFMLPIAFKLRSNDHDLGYPMEEHLDDVYNTVTQMPEYPEGKEKMYQFLSKNLVYPKDAKELNVQGTVVVSFVVNEKGKLSNFAIVDDAYYSLNIEALRVSKLLPPFKPGMKDGVAVKVRYRLPVSFVLSDDTANNIEYFEYDTVVGYADEWVRSKVIYPEKARKNNVQGIVKIRFRVATDGQIISMKITQSTHSSLNAEALRVMHLLSDSKLLKIKNSKNYSTEFELEFPRPDPDSVKARLMLDKGLYSITNLQINNGNSEFGASFFENGKILFGSNRDRTKDKTFEKIFTGKPNEKGNITTSELFKSFPSAISVRPMNYIERSHELYIMDIQYNREEGDFLSKISHWVYLQAQNRWIDTITDVPLFNSYYKVFNARFSQDLQILYFTSDMPGGFGGFDIYKCVKEPNGKWSLPINLGPMINTSLNETSPFVANDGTFYFASNGHGGLGDMDIFCCKPTKDGFSTPVNLGFPINSKSDDFDFIIDAENKFGYFSSNRDGGKGGDDIYKFEKKMGN